MRLKVGITVTFCIAQLAVAGPAAAAETSGAGYDETQGAHEVLGALVAETVLAASAAGPSATGATSSPGGAPAGRAATAAEGGPGSAATSGADERDVASTFHPRVGRQLAARVAPVPIDSRDVGFLALASAVLALTGAALTGAGVARGRRRQERYDAL